MKHLSNKGAYYISNMMYVRQNNGLPFENNSAYAYFDSKEVALNKLKLILNALDRHYTPKLKNNSVYYYINTQLIINTFSYCNKLDGTLSLFLDECCLPYYHGINAYNNDLIIHKNCFKSYYKAKKYKEIIKNILDNA